VVKNIFLDIDGVCNAFHQHVFTSLGLLYADDSWYPVDCGWDIVAAANRLAGYERFTRSGFWKSLTREMWADTPVSAEFAYILGWAECKVGRDHIYFLTSPTLDPDCVAGKLEWIQTHTPKWMHRQYMIGPAKHLCAKTGALLIDDSDDKVDEFEEEGGNAILVPRPWNSLHGINALDHFAEQFPWY